MLTMWPPRRFLGSERLRSTICLPKTREPLTTPTRLTPMMASQSSAEVSRKPPITAMPALLTTRSGTPCASLTAAANSSMAAASATSTR